MFDKPNLSSPRELFDEQIKENKCTNENIKKASILKEFISFLD
jgi:hypothetical protein